MQDYARFVCFTIISFKVLRLFLFRPDEVPSIISGKLALKYHGTDLDAMQAIATAAKKRSLADFNLVCFLILSHFINFCAGIWSPSCRIAVRYCRQGTFSYIIGWYVGERFGTHY
jgi:hypothetical protein